MTEPADLRATRLAYDTVAADYVELLRDELAAKPLDRALLATFAELVEAAGGGPVVEVGCGPGRVAAHLHGLGVDVRGVDLSPAMVAVARLEHPDMRFDEGSMTDLDLPDGALGGVVAWYSIIHTPPGRLPIVFAELARVLRRGGHLLLAFQAGDERVALQRAYGHTISLDAYRLPPDRIAQLFGDAGLVERTRVLRQPEGREPTAQAYVIAMRADLP